LQQPSETPELFRRVAAELADASNRRDVDAFAALWHPNGEWHPFHTARVEGDPGYHGHNGIRAWFEDLGEMFAETRVELDDVRDIRGRLVGLGQITARGAGSEAEISNEVAWVLELDGELVRRGWAYTSHEDALRAAWGIG
jgi:ketosteroid isomerase-like protein